MSVTHPHHYESPHAPTWCPGCGNFAIWTALKRALAELGRPPHRVLMVYGIGCSGNMANTMGTYGWHSLHGRALPTAEGAKLANGDLTVLAAAGDGDGYGEGMSHFIHAVRSNIDITYVVHNNSIYGLTTGQASPTSPRGFKAKSTPDGLIEEPVNPLALAISAGTNFAARGFSGDLEGLTELLKKAIEHRGFSLVDIFQPCVTFNHANTFEFYNSAIDYLREDAAYDASDRMQALERVLRSDRLAVGVVYQSDSRVSYDHDLDYLGGKALVSRPPRRRDVSPLMKKFM